MNRVMSGLILSIVFATMLLLTRDASAVSVLASYGIGGGGDLSNSKSFALDVFVYEGKNYDFFIGGESLSFENDGISSGTVLKGTATLLEYGLRYKFTSSSAWKWYVELGGITGSAKYDIPASESSYFKDEGSISVKAARSFQVGLGFDYGISESLSLGFDLRALNGLPFYDTTPYTRSTPRTTPSQPLMSEPGGVFVGSLGVRYHF